MNDKVFVDTNIFIYIALNAENEQHKRLKSIEVLQEYANRVVISTQVINEFYSAKLKNSVSDEIIQNKINQILSETHICILTLTTIKLAWQLKEKYKVSLWDSLILAAALNAKCTTLFSEDMQDNLVIEGKLKIVNPLK